MKCLDGSICARYRDKRRESAHDVRLWRRLDASGLRGIASVSDPASHGCPIPGICSIPITRRRNAACGNGFGGVADFLLPDRSAGDGACLQTLCLIEPSDLLMPASSFAISATETDRP
jgi:hypothetical protein